MIYFTLLILFSINVHAKETWLDPFSIDLKESNDVPATRNYKVDSDFVITHYQRSLNLLLNILKYDEETKTYSGKLNPTLSSEEHNFLKEFSKLHADNPNNWRKIDDILGGIYNKSVFDKTSDFIISLQESLVLFLYRKEALVFLCSLLFIIFSYNLFTHKLKLKSVFSYLCFIFYVIDFSFTWIRLLQEKEVEKLLKSKMRDSLPPYCDPSQMSSYNFLKYKLFSTHKECENFYKSQYLDDFWIVSPLKVAVVQFSNFIETPAEAIGNAFGKFFNSIIYTTTWSNMIFIPFILLFTVLLFAIILSFVTQTTFGFNFFHIIQFYFGGPSKENVTINNINTSRIEDIKLEKSDEENKQSQIKYVKALKNEKDNLMNENKVQSESLKLLDVENENDYTEIEDLKSMNEQKETEIEEMESQEIEIKENIEIKLPQIEDLKSMEEHNISVD